MKKNKVKNKKTVQVQSSTELAAALGLSSSDQILMEYKARLSEMAVQAIERSNLSVNDIVKNSGVARSKVSAIKNGALAGISSDLFFKVIIAAGQKVSFRLAS